MGTIRWLLAISVLITHSGPIFGITLLNGDMAITNFFIISGFLMALILDERYRSSIKKFYVNRFLRIYPPYIAALLFSIIFFFFYRNGAHNPWKFFNQFEHIGEFNAFCAISNITMLGLDISRYINIDITGLIFPNFMHPHEGDSIHSCLFVPQGWTLALEIWFYLLVPFIFRWRTGLLILAVILIFIADYYTNIKIRGIDTLAFFPLALRFFLLGMIAFRLHKYYSQHQDSTLPSPKKRIIAFIGFLFCIVLVVYGRDIMIFIDNLKLIDPYYRNSAYYLLFALSLPFAFSFGNNFKIDNALGEYSYPIYLFHYPIAKWAERTLSDTYIGIASLVLTMVISAIYIYTIDPKIQSIRNKVRKSKLIDPRSINIKYSPNS